MKKYQKALQLAIKIVGSQSQLARLLDVDQSYIHWSLFKSLNGIGKKHCKKIEKLTQGKVKAKDLRPDLVW